ncbi:magnetosome protein MamC [Desulfovibrio inopinatus]|uniref:magnetosome protein MamC n=1 Tax=Desulfovibrio inopinatus TaxID=102109 RepID=UPI00040F6E6D|nr:magnetosome protein MamC [Desulfovibrio inopinatus]
MALYTSPAYVPSQYQQTRLPVGAVATMGLVGAMMGGMVAAARGIRDSQTESTTRGEILGHVLKESVGAGLAAAAGTAAAGVVSRNSALSLVAMTAVGIGTKYFYDGLVNVGKSTTTSS